MVQLISAALLFSVVCAIEADVPHRYHFVKENKTWSEAQTYCREKYTDLASINNKEEMMKLNPTLKKENAKQAWIRRQKEDTARWRWSLADQTFDTEGDIFTNWENGQPANETGNQFCVYLKKINGRWHDYGCNARLAFVCYEDNNTDRYVEIHHQKTWREAQAYCQENHIDLVSVRNQTENDEIWEVIKNSSNGIFWIGLFHDSWKELDQSKSSLRSCSAVSEQHHWTDVNCTETLPFICHENRLILIKQNLTWWEALNHCRDHYYDLVSVRTEEMQLWVKEMVQDASTEHVWLGLRHDCAQRIWFWVFGTMVCYQGWAPGYGTWNEDCSHEMRSGAVQSGGQQQWVDLPQSYKLNFICSTYDKMF